MSVQVKIPAVGESISSGRGSVWHNKSGEQVKKGDPFFTLETDKVSTEIVAETDGVLRTKAAEGQEVKIGEVVAEIEESSATGAAPTNKEKGAPEQTSVAAVADRRPPEVPTPPTDIALSPAGRRVVDEEKIHPPKNSGNGKSRPIYQGGAAAGS